MARMAAWFPVAWRRVRAWRNTYQKDGVQIPPSALRGGSVLLVSVGVDALLLGRDHAVTLEMALLSGHQHVGKRFASQRRPGVYETVVVGKDPATGRSVQRTFACHGSLAASEVSLSWPTTSPSASRRSTLRLSRSATWCS